MLKSYEAIYEHGQLKWVAERPSIPDGGRVIVVVEIEESSLSRDEKRRVMQQTWGAWGSGKSLDELDRDIAAMRADWERDWNPAE